MQLKISLDTVGYAAYFYEGEPHTLEECLQKAADYGFDAIDVWPHRPVGFPMDISKQRRKDLVKQASDLGLDIAAIEACTDFRRSNHVLVPGQEFHIRFVRDCCELAADLNCPTVRILAGFVGYFWHQGWDKGYGNTAMWDAQTWEVSRQEDFLIEWGYVQDGIAECAEIAAEFGVYLALQNHPPVTNSTEETLAMIEEINHPNLRMGLDLPLFESQDPEFIRSMVQRVGKERFQHSHLIGLRRLGGLHAAYGFEEVPPWEGDENWIEFFKACHDIGYDKYFAHEQCSAVIMPGHVKPAREEFDRRYQETLKWVKKVFADIEAGKL